MGNFTPNEPDLSGLRSYVDERRKKEAREPPAAATSPGDRFGGLRSYVETRRKAEEKAKAEAEWGALAKAHPGLSMFSDTNFGPPKNEGWAEAPSFMGRPVPQTGIPDVDDANILGGIADPEEREQARWKLAKQHQGANLARPKADVPDDRLLSDEEAKATAKKRGTGFLPTMRDEFRGEKGMGKVPFFGGFHDAAAAMERNAVRKRVAQGPEAYAFGRNDPDYERDRRLVAAWENNERIETVRREAAPVRTVAANIVANMLTFAAEMGGSGAALKALFKGSGTAAAKGGAKAAIKRIAKFVGTAGAEAALQPGRVAANAAERAGDRHDITGDDLETMSLAVERYGDSELKALWKGYLDQVVEVGSERFGEIIGGAIGKGINRARKGFKLRPGGNVHKMPAKVADFFRVMLGEAPESGVANGIARAMSQGGVQPLLEGAEERAGDVARVLLGLDEHEEGATLGDRLLNALPDRNQMMAEWVGFLLPGGIAAAAGTAEHRLQVHRLKRNVRKECGGFIAEHPDYGKRLDRAGSAEELHALYTEMDALSKAIPTLEATNPEAAARAKEAVGGEEAAKRDPANYVAALAREVEGAAAAQPAAAQAEQPAPPAKPDPVATAASAAAGDPAAVEETRQEIADINSGTAFTEEDDALPPEEPHVPTEAEKARGFAIDEEAAQANEALLDAPDEAEAPAAPAAPSPVAAEAPEAAREEPTTGATPTNADNRTETPAQPQGTLDAGASAASGEGGGLVDGGTPGKSSESREGAPQEVRQTEVAEPAAAGTEAPAAESQGGAAEEAPAEREYTAEELAGKSRPELVDILKAEHPGVSTIGERKKLAERILDAQRRRKVEAAADVAYRAGQEAVNRKTAAGKVAIRGNLLRKGDTVTFSDGTKATVTEVGSFGTAWAKLEGGGEVVLCSGNGAQVMGRGAARAESVERNGKDITEDFSLDEEARNDTERKLGDKVEGKQLERMRRLKQLAERMAARLKWLGLDIRVEGIDDIAGMSPEARQALREEAEKDGGMPPAFYHNGQIWLLYTADETSLMHETTHAIVDWAKRKHPRLARRLDRLMAEAPEVAIRWAKDNYSPDEFAEEALAELCGRAGRAGLAEALEGDEKAKGWWQRFKKATADVCRRALAALSGSNDTYVSLEGKSDEEVARSFWRAVFGEGNGEVRLSVPEEEPGEEAGREEWINGQKGVLTQRGREVLAYLRGIVGKTFERRDESGGRMTETVLRITPKGNVRLLQNYWDRDGNHTVRDREYTQFATQVDYRGSKGTGWREAALPATEGKAAEEASGAPILNGDDVRRDNLPGYDPADWRTHIDRSGIVARKMEERFQELLRTRKGKGNGEVVFLAGGNGVGKSTFAGELGGTPDFTIDSTLGNLAVVRKQLEAILANGQRPVIVFVYRTPEQALDAIQGRVKNGGHSVSPLSFADSHTKSLRNLGLLAQEYGNRIEIHIYDNSVEGAPEITLEQLEAKGIPNHADIRKRANEVLGKAQGALDGAPGKVGIRKGGGGSEGAEGEGRREAQGALDGQVGAGRAAEGGGGSEGAQGEGSRRSGPEAVAPPPAPAPETGRWGKAKVPQLRAELKRRGLKVPASPQKMREALAADDARRAEAKERQRERGRELLARTRNRTFLDPFLNAVFSGNRVIRVPSAKARERARKDSNAPQVGGEWDGFDIDRFPGLRDKFVFVNSGWDPIDSLMDEARNAYFGGRGMEENADSAAEYGPDWFWDTLEQAAKTEREAKAHEADLAEQGRQAERFERDAFSGRGGNETVQARELAMGDKVTVNGVELTVTDIDGDTGEAILSDGSRYGHQRVAETDTIHVDAVATGEEQAAAKAAGVPDKAALNAMKRSELIEQMKAEKVKLPKAGRLARMAKPALVREILKQREARGIAQPVEEASGFDFGAERDDGVHFQKRGGEFSLDVQTKEQAVDEARRAEAARKEAEKQRRREEAGRARAEAGRIGERDDLAQGTLALGGTGETGSLFAPRQNARKPGQGMLFQKRGDMPTEAEISEAERQQSDATRRYADKNGNRTPGWKKAPNGNDSNLEDRAWVQVRTDNFKRFAGDWESLAVRQQIDAAPVAKIHAGAFKRLPGISVQKTGSKLLATPVTHETPIGTVLIDSRSAKDSLGHKYGPAKLDALVTLQKDFKNAIYIGFGKDFEGKPIDNHYFAYPAEYNGERHIVFCRVRKDSNSNRLYVHEVFTDSEINQGDALQTAARQSRTPHGSIAFARNFLRKLYSVKPDSVTKVVDENGEPLVVYRGADFDPLAQAPGKGVIKPEAYFTSDPEYAARYARNGGKVRAYFLNIRHPFDIRDPECLKDLKRIFPDHDFARGASGALDWAEASVVDAEFLEEHFGDKYDGIVYDEGGDPMEGGARHRGVSYVPLRGGSQVKSATDNVGTYSERNDIRFQKRGAAGEGFRGRKSVERRKDLVALHNINAAKLKSMDELGGSAMPSVAVTKDTVGFDKFGEITLLVRPETIDPKAPGSKAKLFSNDAWTPTFPETRRHANEKKANELDTRFYRLFKDPKNAEWEKAADGWSVIFDEDNLDDALTKHGGDAIAALRDDRAAKVAYLLETGKAPAVPTKAVLPEWRGLDASAIPAIAEALGDRLHRGREGMSMSDADDLIQDDDFQRKLAETLDATPQVRELIDHNPNMSYVRQLERGRPAAKRYWDVQQLSDAVSGHMDGRGVPQTTDRVAAHAAVDEAIAKDPAAYDAWLRTLTNGLTDGGQWVRNKRDPYNRAGSRRSFKELHDPLTLANAVRAMSSQATQGGSGFFAGNPFGTAARKYGSLDEVIADESRLKSLPKEEIDAIKDALSGRFREIADEYGKTQAHKDSNQFIQMDRDRDMLLDSFAETRGDKAKLLKALNTYGYKADADLVDRFLKVMDDMSKMPVDYFEAKAYRAVGFDEFAAAVIPDDASQETRDILQRRGIRTFEYKAGDAAARLRAVNAAADEDGGLRFQKSGLYTGSAADYANRREDGTIENGPSLHKIGTGEGNQVYGWGLYASDQRGVAEKYAKEGGSNNPRSLAFNWLKYSGDRDETIAWVKQGLKDGAFDTRNGVVLEALKLLESGKDITEPKGNLYEQTFFTNRATPEETERHLLKWYEPVSDEQLEWIKARAKEEGWKLVDEGNGISLVPPEEKQFSNATVFLPNRKNALSGGDAYLRIAGAIASPKDASEFLARAGIDGVKYPVDSFRGPVKDGDKVGWNYVSFRDDNIEVNHKWRDGEMLFQRRGAEERDWSAATPQEMRKELAARGLSPAGDKEHLRMRLEGDDRRRARDEGGADGMRFQKITINGREMMVVPGHALTKNDAKDERKVKDLLRNTVVGKEFRQLGEPEDKLVRVGEDFPGEFWKSNDSEALRRKRDKIWHAKVDAAANLEDMLATTALGKKEHPRHGNRAIKRGATFYRCDTQFGIYDWRGVSVYPCQLLVLETETGVRYVWDIVGMKKPTLAAKGELSQEVIDQLEMSTRGAGTPVTQPQSAPGSKPENGGPKLQKRDWGKADYRELVAELRARGLPRQGTPAKLRQRLEEDDSNRLSFQKTDGIDDYVPPVPNGVDTDLIAGARLEAAEWDRAFVAKNPEKEGEWRILSEDGERIMADGFKSEDAAKAGLARRTHEAERLATARATLGEWTEATVEKKNGKWRIVGPEGTPAFSFGYKTKEAAEEALARHPEGDREGASVEKRDGTWWLVWRRPVLAAGYASQDAAEADLARYRAAQDLEAVALSRYRKGEIERIAESRRALIQTAIRTDRKKGELAEKATKHLEELGIPADMIAKEVRAIVSVASARSLNQSLANYGNLIERIDGALVRAAARKGARAIVAEMKKRLPRTTAAGVKVGGLTEVAAARTAFFSDLSPGEIAEKVNSLHDKVAELADRLLDRSLDDAERAVKEKESDEAQAELFAWQVFGGLNRDTHARNVPPEVLKRVNKALAELERMTREGYARVKAERQARRDAAAADAQRIREELEAGRTMPRTNAERTEQGRHWRQVLRDFFHGVTFFTGIGPTLTERLVYDKNVPLRQGALTQATGQANRCINDEIRRDEEDADVLAGLLRKHLGVKAGRNLSVVQIVDRASQLKRIRPESDKRVRLRSVEEVEDERGKRRKVVPGGYTRLSLGQLMTVWAWGQRAATLAGQPYSDNPVARPGFNRGPMTGLITHGFAAETMKEVETVLREDGVLDLARDILADMNRKNAELNEMNRFLFGCDMTQQDNYFPFKRDYAAPYDGDETGDGAGKRFMSTIRSFLKEVTTTSKDFKFDHADMLDIWANHQHQVNHLLSHYRFLSHMRMVLSDHNLQRSLSYFIGERGKKALETYFDTLARGGAFHPKSEATLDAAASAMAASVIPSVRVALKQTTSAPAALAALPEGASVVAWAGDVASIYANLKLRRKFLAFMDANVPMWRARYRAGGAGTNVQLAQAARSGNGRLGFFRRRVSEVAGAIPKWGDRWGGLPGVYGVFMAHVRQWQAEHPGAAETEAWHACAQKAMDAMNETQQSSLSSYLSQAQAVGGTWRLLTMFKSAPMAISSNFWNAVHQLHVGRGSAKTHVRTILGLWMAQFLFREMSRGMLPVLNAVFGAGDGGDDDETRKKGLATMAKDLLYSGIDLPFGGIPILSAASEMVLNTALGEGTMRSFAENVLPPAQLVDSALRAVKRLANVGEMTPRQKFDLACDSIGSAAAFAGLPVRAATDVGLGLYDAATAEDLSPQERVMRPFFSRNSMDAPREGRKERIRRAAASSGGLVGW